MTNDEREARIENAYCEGNLAYFHGVDFVADLAALGWGLGDLVDDLTYTTDDEGKIKPMRIWPDPIRLKLP
jgi:hypothetical protein